LAQAVFAQALTHFAQARRPSRTRVRLSTCSGPREMMSSFFCRARVGKGRAWGGFVPPRDQNEGSGIPVPPPTPGGKWGMRPQRSHGHVARSPSSLPWSRSREMPKLGQGDTITIVDWDDTLLCTSFLKESCRSSVLDSFFARFDQKDRGVVPSAVLGQLQRIEEAAKALLEEALQMGPTYIVTNSESGWVHRSAGKYIPGVLPLLDEVTVVSARDLYEAQYPAQEGSWKKRAFLQIAKGLDLEMFHDLIVLGDREYEMDAADIVGSISPNLLVKVVKFRQNPSAQDLLMEQLLVLHNLPNFKDSDKSLTVTLERTPCA